MILAVDVQYEDDGGATVAGVLFKDWNDPEPARAVLTQVSEVQDYEPGQFYKRELPCILQLLDAIPETVDIIVVDGYVSLGADDRPGLGMHLHNALQQRIPVIGVAKKAFLDTPPDREILRGDSLKPLYVSAVGIPLPQARDWIHSMHGKHRIPTLLKRVDQLCRGSWRP
ncbi:endonuclease V [Hahella aquimaris]|uniref:endonuclease V n=1 Tax=Hahella sp. HNIBRBA332 TaxID=3015983 RepID=UPI00273C4FED|nr:endonuclease V [Hahella sp. HNIBRBA332]WLQ12420.1 endonuclease V [Hahella sp. HNIBRBA332]